jgi:hypothetical protein
MISRLLGGLQAGPNPFRSSNTTSVIVDFGVIGDFICFSNAIVSLTIWGLFKRIFENIAINWTEIFQ